MQYVRSIGGSVSKTWNSINPATLSGAIDVIVVEHEDGSLACSPFHVRFGKFSLLRPYEKKVEFRVNNVKQDYAMKLGEGGEAFFVFETSEDIPEGLQTSPLLSPAASPKSLAGGDTPASTLQEPDFLDISAGDGADGTITSSAIRPKPFLSPDYRTQSDLGQVSTLSTSVENFLSRPGSREWSAPPERSASDAVLPLAARTRSITLGDDDPTATDALYISAPAPQPSTTPPLERPPHPVQRRSNSPPPLSGKEAVDRAITLSKKLSGSNIPTHITDTGDLMLDMTGYKSSEDDALRAEMIARKILSEELEGAYDIGALIGADEHGNLWIYSSEEAKEAANRKHGPHDIRAQLITGDAASDIGYHSDDGKSSDSILSPGGHQRAASESGLGLATPPQTPPGTDDISENNRNYAKTLRLTSDQLKALNLKSGPNLLSFTVNRATCQAYMYLWRWNVPVVISDIDGTITKSDALGHVLNMIGRDWTHVGVAKLYTDIVSNGYNILYLTSRSVGQADSTRAYLNGVMQEGYKLPKGPVIMSPDRTIAALRREIYLRKPEVFKMACLRDIKNLYPPNRNPFYAGFGNRLTDALSYRSVNIPSNRIFTINSNAEVSLDLLSLNKYKSSYVTMRELLDHFFPPVSMLVEEGGEQCTDFNYWRDAPLDVVDFSASESDEKSDYDDEDEIEESLRSEDEMDEELAEENNTLADSYLTRSSMDEAGGLEQSVLESIEGDDAPEESILEDEESTAPIDDSNDGDKSFDVAGEMDDELRTVRTGPPSQGKPSEA